MYSNDPLDRAEQLAKQLSDEFTQFENNSHLRFEELLQTWTASIQHHISAGFINATTWQTVNDDAETTTIRLGLLTRIIDAINIYEHSSNTGTGGTQSFDMPTTLLSPADVERIKIVRWIMLAKENDGYTFTEASDQAGISDSTFRKWRKLYSDYL